MVPAQASTSLDHERKPEVAPKPDTERANGGDSHASQDGMSVRCMNNCEDNTFDAEIFSDQHKVDEMGDVEVDILECVDNVSIGSARVDDPDATDTEYSSSFGDTLSGSDSVSKLNLSDTEVESQFRVENGLPTVFDSAFRMRKKKLTAHWKNYIRPLMWRCKWMELKMKELQYQALKYDRELAACNQAKQFMVGQVASESCAARLVPLSYQNNRKKAMRRRKRKRIEETVDISSYMSRHRLFSYYENKFEADGGSVDDDCSNQVITGEQNIQSADEFGVNCEWPELEFRDGDYSLEKVLWNIEVMQARVLKLKTQLNKVVFRNAGKSSSTENLSLFTPSELPTSSARSPTFSAGNGDAMPVGALYASPQHISELEFGDLVMPESVVSSYDEAATLPDIIESTVGLLSAVDFYCDEPQIGNVSQDIVDEVLIDNQVVEEELQNFEKVSQPVEKPLELVKENPEKESITPLVLAPEVGPPLETVLEPKPDCTPETVPEPGQSRLRHCFPSEFRVPKNKRKRADRRAGLGGWNVEKIRNSRSTGEPDNQ